MLDPLADAYFEGPDGLMDAVADLLFCEVAEPAPDLSLRWSYLTGSYAQPAWRNLDEAPSRECY